MSFLFYCLFWILGLIIGSMGLVQMMIVLFFSKPFTKKMNNMGLLTDVQTISKRDNLTLLVWLVIIALVSTVVYLLASSESFIAYLVGAGITVLMGFGKIGMNQDNLKDYISANGRFLNLDGFNNENVDEEFANTILTLYQQDFLKKMGNIGK